MNIKVHNRMRPNFNDILENQEISFNYVNHLFVCVFISSSGDNERMVTDLKPATEYNLR